MKKRLALLLACTMALSLTACGGGKAADPTTTAAPATTAATEAAGEESKEAADTTAAEAAGGDMDALIEAAKAEGELTVYGSCEARTLKSSTESRQSIRDFPLQKFIPRFLKRQENLLPMFGSAEPLTLIMRRLQTDC